jgi:hypothetical protein
MGISNGKKKRKSRKILPSLGNGLEEQGKELPRDASIAGENTQPRAQLTKARRTGLKRRGVLTRLLALLSAPKLGNVPPLNEEMQLRRKEAVLDYSIKRALDLNFEMGMSKYHEEFWRKYCG